MLQRASGSSELAWKGRAGRARFADFSDAVRNCGQRPRRERLRLLKLFQARRSMAGNPAGCSSMLLCASGSSSSAPGCFWKLGACLGRPSLGARSLGNMSETCRKDGRRRRRERLRLLKPYSSSALDGREMSGASFRKIRFFGSGRRLAASEAPKIAGGASLARRENI